MSPRVWVTRDEEPGGELSAALRAAGLDPVLEPVLARRIVAEPTELLKGLGRDDWLALASPFAARAFRGLSTPAHIAVVGDSTARACRDVGFRVDLVSAEASGASLWPALWPRITPGATVCYPRSSLAETPRPPQGLHLTAPVLYSTDPREFDARIVDRVEVATLASPSAVHRIAGLAALPPCASIGPTTSGAMRAHNIPVWVESSTHTFDDLASVIAMKLRTRP